MTRYFDVHAAGSAGLDAEFVDIVVKNFGEDEKGRKLISPQMRSEQEVDRQVDLLICELNEVREQAKEVLRRRAMRAVPAGLVRKVVHS